MSLLAAVASVPAVAAVLAAATPSPTSSGNPAGSPIGNPGDNPDHIGPGPIAFWTVVALGIGLFLLVRSMGHHMRKVDFDDGSADEQTPGGPGTDGVGTDGVGADGVGADGVGTDPASGRRYRDDTIPAVPPVRPDVPVSLRRPPRRR